MTNAKELLGRIVEGVEEEFRDQLAVLIRMIPDDQAERMVTDLQTVGTQLQAGDDDAARSYVAKRYGAGGVLMLDQMIERVRSVDQDGGEFEEVIPSGNVGDTAFITSLLSPLLGKS